MTEIAPGSGNEIEGARLAYDVSGDEMREAIARKEQARLDYEAALNETVKDGIVIDGIKTDKYGNPFVEFEISGEVFASFREEGKVASLPDEDVFYSMTIGPNDYSPLLGRSTQDVRIVVPPIEQAEKYRDTERYRGLEDKPRAFLIEPLVYFVVDGQLFKAPMSGLDWHVAELEPEVAATN